jgi:hypothetical protein
MPEYEIVILKSDHTKASFIFEQTHADDFAAVRAAAKFAGANLFEVWRDIECIYGLPSDRNVLPMSSGIGRYVEEQSAKPSAK